MTDHEKRLTAEQLESYLDNTMSPDEKSDFERRLAIDPQATRQIQLQRDVDAGLKRIFDPPQALADEIQRLVEAETLPEVRPVLGKSQSHRRVWLAAALSLAAMAAWAAVAWQWGDQEELEPLFQPRPLANIYRETVARGFRPYYFCEDDERFAQTFLERQDVPLRLTSLPHGQRMVGLSYPGGLSQDTTAMLCYVDETPVMVFVDRSQADQSIVTASAEPELKVHRREFAGLVIYEVLPLNRAVVMEHLSVASSHR